MITFSLLKVYHQALKSTNLFQSLTIILKARHYLQLNSKVSVTKAISLIPGDNFFSISNNNSTSSSVTSYSFSANSNNSNSDKYNYSDPDNCYRLYSEKHKLFSLYFGCNTNGWNYGKRDGIEYFNSLFNPLFICFQETGNDTDLSGEYPCKAKLPNYKYFSKRSDTSIPKALEGCFYFTIDLFRLPLKIIT